jgi:hypothetical protein
MYFGLLESRSIFSEVEKSGLEDIRIRRHSQDPEPLEGACDELRVSGELLNVSPSKMLSGANTFEISDIQEDETEAVLTKEPKQSG